MKHCVMTSWSSIKLNSANSALAKSVSFMKLLRYYFCAVLLAVYVLLVCEFLTLFRKGVGDLGIGTLVQTENILMLWDCQNYGNSKENQAIATKSILICYSIALVLVVLLGIGTVSIFNTGSIRVVLYCIYFQVSVLDWSWVWTIQDI